MDNLSDDLLALVARFLSVSDLFICSVLSSNLHHSFDSDSVWRPRLPSPTTTTTAAASTGTARASCKSRYIALHACSEHGVQRCFRLLPLSEPVRCAERWPTLVRRNKPYSLPGQASRHSSAALPRLRSRPSRLRAGLAACTRKQSVD